MTRNLMRRIARLERIAAGEIDDRTTVCPYCGGIVAAVLARTPNDAAVELYYRRRANGVRTTLKKVAEELGMSYGALLKHKQRYDAAGKWGSKGHARP